MNTHRCVEEGVRGKGGQANPRYHSEEGVDPQALARLRKNMHSNQSHYLSRNFRERFRSIEVNDNAALPPSPLPDTLKIDRPKDVTLPQIPARQANDCYRILLKKGKPFSNLAVLQQSKKAKLVKGHEQRARTFAYLSNLGGRTKNEDRVSVETITTRQCTYQYFAVFDGHGGYLTSNYLSLHLHLVLESFLSEERPPAEALRLSLALLEEKLRKNPRIGSKSGSCALVCLATGENCWVANVGDSRLLTVGEEGVVQVTRDHKPEQEAEKARILNNGGEVYRKLPEEGEEVHSRDIPYRVYPGKLSVSRTIGDVHIKRENSRVVIADPEIFTVALKGLSHLLLLTDGVYEKLSNNEIANCFLPAARPEDGIRAVFELAESRRSEDNRSMVAVRLK